MTASVFVHIVSFHHANYLNKCVSSVLKQEGYQIGKNLSVLVSDNNSGEGTDLVLKSLSSYGVKTVINAGNYGFAAAHNIGLAEFLESAADFYLCLNPDLSLKEDALQKLTEAALRDVKAGTACPILFRADENLDPLSPPVIDAAGMRITSSLRHFDRGAGEINTINFNKEEYVFGGSGACLLMKKDFVRDVIFDQEGFRPDVLKVYPQLKLAPVKRAEVFDEAFFAYREDADLAWRSQLLGWECLYVPQAVGYHVRKVTPERRHNLSSDINLLGVKNRFLLQLNNYSFSYGLKAFILGYFLRNLLVIFSVFLNERSSLPAFSQFLKLFRRGLNRRALLAKRMKVKHRVISDWFDR